MKKLLRALVCVGALQASVLTASAQGSQSPDALYSAGVEARLQGRLETSVDLLRQTVLLQASNADALVQLGLAYLALDRRSEAELAFNQALTIAPDYFDATVGLAQIRFRDRDIDGASALVESVLQKAPNMADANLLAARIASFRGDSVKAVKIYETILASDPANFDALVGLGDEQRRIGNEPATLAAYNRALSLNPASSDVTAKLAAGPPPLWRLDTNLTISDVLVGYAVWTDTVVGITYQATPQTTLQLTTRLATRPGQEDLQTGLRVDHGLGSGAAIYAGITIAPDAQFLPLLAAEAGALSAPIQLGPFAGPVILGLDVRHAAYRDAAITTIAPSLHYFLVPERLSVAVRWVHTTDWTDNATDGYVLRLDYQATDQLALFAGYADAPEIDGGDVVPSVSVFAGLSFDLKQDVTLRASYALDMRSASDRQSVGIGLVVKF